MRGTNQPLGSQRERHPPSPGLDSCDNPRCFLSIRRYAVYPKVLEIPHQESCQQNADKQRPGNQGVVDFHILHIEIKREMQDEPDNEVK
jgi:hypothetical protein